MITKITNFTVHYTAEGTRVSYAFSQIDENGNLVKSNQRGSIFVMDEDANKDIENINTWLLGKVEGK